MVARVIKLLRGAPLSLSLVMHIIFFSAALLSTVTSIASRARVTERPGRAVTR